MRHVMFAVFKRIDYGGALSVGHCALDVMNGSYVARGHAITDP